MIFAPPPVALRALSGGAEQVGEGDDFSSVSLAFLFVAVEDAGFLRLALLQFLFRFAERALELDKPQEIGVGTVANFCKYGIADDGLHVRRQVIFAEWHAAECRDQFSGDGLRRLFAVEHITAIIREHLLDQLAVFAAAALGEEPAFKHGGGGGAVIQRAEIEIGFAGEGAGEVAHRGTLKSLPRAFLAGQLQFPGDADHDDGLVSGLRAVDENGLVGMEGQRMKARTVAVLPQHAQLAGQQDDLVGALEIRVDEDHAALPVIEGRGGLAAVAQCQAEGGAEIEERCREAAFAQN